jgi:hypothetical protein
MSGLLASRSASFRVPIFDRRLHHQKTKNAEMHIMSATIDAGSNTGSETPPLRVCGGGAGVCGGGAGGGMGGRGGMGGLGGDGGSGGD